MPEDFDTVSYEAVHSRAATRKESSPESYSQFAGAWRAVAYRFKSCTEHDLAFTESIQRTGDAPPSPERYIQERELFCFFVAGLAVIESFYYGMFAVASMLDSTSFPVATPGDLRFITPKKTAERFADRFREERLTAALDRTINSNAYREWKDVRNILAHRTAPGRIIYASVGSTKRPPQPAQWKIGTGMQLDESTTSSRRKWLAETVGTLLREADGFTASRL
jgi:hypothetical protein